MKESELRAIPPSNKLAFELANEVLALRAERDALADALLEQIPHLPPTLRDRARAALARAGRK